MKSLKKISRRKILQFFASLSGLGAAMLWLFGTKRTMAVNSPVNIVLSPSLLNDGVTIRENLVIIKKQNTLQVYSSRCPHLGCRISGEHNNRLICPCHGSQFSLDGQVVKGPAASPLQELNYWLDENTGEITVHVS